MNSNNQFNGTRFVVKDVKQIFFTLIVAVGPLAYNIYNGMYWGAEFVPIFLFYVLPILAFLRLRAIFNGTVIDIENNTLEYPGGNLSPDNLSDYISPRFLLQFFLRFKIGLDEISQISTSYKRHISDKGTVSYSYYIQVDGTHGSFKIFFTDEGKRDQLYSLIRGVNNMGTPVFKA